jgi:hypothetical protein
LFFLLSSRVSSPVGRYAPFISSETLIPETFCQHLQHRQADVLFAGFHFRDVAAINTESVRHLDLGKAMFHAQCAKPLAEPGGTKPAVTKSPA